jgi:glucose/arabinose dehydrogenase
MKTFYLQVKACALIAFVVFLNTQISKAQTLPAGFSKIKVASLDNGTAMAFAPDGRLFISTKDGNIRIIKNGALLGTPFLTLTVAQDGERGISGITFDPNFNTNHYVYVYYTMPTPTIHNRLSRFTANGDVVLGGSEYVLQDFETVNSVYHNGGGMGFGIDGKLYLAMGEDNSPNNAQDMTTHKGKLLRFNADGSTPTDNPYYSSTNVITRRIWCLGLRNPYTLSIQPGTGKIYINNVGSDTWEEVHDGTAPGQNFGWPIVEGFSTNPAYVNPVFAYPHSSTTGQYGCAITGGCFFNPSSTTYPAQYVGKYFYQDFCDGWMYYFTPGTPATNNTFFGSNLITQNLALQVGPDGNLYYINRYNTDAGIYKIIYTNNNSPAITNQPQSQTVTAGQPAIFSVSASGATPLSYQWKKNGTNITGANASTYSIGATAAGDAGQYSVLVSNSYGSALSNAATLSVTAYNAAPVATINTPPPGTYFRAGDTIRFSGSATDAEDGTLPASAYSWTIQLWHNHNHFHPGTVIPPGVTSGSFVTSQTDHTDADIFYRIILIVTDSHGLHDTAFVDVLPILATLNFTTDPAGLQIIYAGQPKTTPFTTQTEVGNLITISAVSPQSLNGHDYVFDHWDKGGAMTHVIKVGDADSSYKAYFRDTVYNCTAQGTIKREYWANVTGSGISAIPLTSPPTSVTYPTIFEAPSNFADYYGQRFSGYICPPLTGNYTFWIASDNGSELWLSTNEDPANKQKIAYMTGYVGQRQWTVYATQQSAPIALVAGKKYYIEALHKEGTGGDNVAVGWQLPNGTLERPIPGTRLSPYNATTGGGAPVVTITSPANNSSFSSSANITISANASSTGGSITKVEFYQGATLLGQATTSPYSFTWMSVPTGNYTLTAKAYDSGGHVTTSAGVSIAVTTCPTPIITASGSIIMCSGSVVLNTTTGPGYTFQWKKDGVNITGATSYTYNASVTGGYQVKVIQGSCIAWSAPTYVKVESGLRAAITPGGSTTFCSGGSVVLYGNTCAGYTYQWIRNGSNIAGATGPTYTATLAGNYQLRVTLSGQNAWSALVSVTVNSCKTPEQPANDQYVQNTEPASITSNERKDEFQMKVYPNPTDGMFTISINMAASKEQKVTLKMLSPLGQVVYTNEYREENGFINQTVDLDKSLATGIYILQITIGDKVENVNVMLAR